MMKRRAFFRFLARDIVVVTEEVRGIQHLKLTDLRELPEERMANIIPKMQDDRPYVIEDGKLWLDDPPSGTRQEVCIVNPVEQTVLESFSGNLTIGQIANRIAVTYSISPQEAFQRTRDFFVRLALRQLCLPTNKV